PLDYWVGAFLQAVFSPTKSMWMKNKQLYSKNPIFNQRLSLYLSAATPHVMAPPPPITTSPAIPVTPPQPTPIQPEPVAPAPTPQNTNPGSTPLPSSEEL